MNNKYSITIKKVFIIMASTLCALAIITFFMYKKPETSLPLALKTIHLYTGFKEKIISTKNHTWSYLERGAGETIVFIHGFGADKNRMIELMAKFDTSYRIIAPDLPGHGKTAHNPKLNYKSKDMVRYLNLFLNTINCRSFHLMGSSMGGGLGVFYAAKYPDKIISLALFNPAGFPSPTESKFWKMYREEGHIAMHYTNREEFDRAMKMIFYKVPNFPDHFVDFFIKYKQAKIPFEKHLFKNLVTAQRAVQASTFQKLKKPVLILWGKYDDIVAPTTVKLLKSIKPDAEIHILNKSGHIPFAEEPEKSFLIYTKFLTLHRQNKSILE